LENDRRLDTLLACDIDGKNLKIVADKEMVSHCYWLDNDNIFGYLREFAGDKYYKININTLKKEVIGEGIIDKFGDGHPTICNEKIVFDTYPNKARMKELYMYDLKSNSLEKLGEFFESFDFYGETRCDLHPRFSLDCKKVFFDSVHSGKRHLYMMELK
jgi:Tol biopolymer transport system component